MAGDQQSTARLNAADRKLITDLDKKVALFGQDLQYVKGSVDDQKESQKETKKTLDTIQESFRNVRFVSPESLDAYVKTHEQVHTAITAELADHDKWIKELQAAASAEKNTFFSRLRVKIGDRAVDLGLVIFYLVVGFVLLQLLTGGGMFKNIIKAINP